MDGAQGTLIPNSAPSGNLPGAAQQGSTQAQRQMGIEPEIRPVHGGLTLAAGSGQVIHLRTGAANVFTADPKVAEVRPASANSLFVFGVAPGTTTVAALGANGEAIAQYQVTVVPSGFDAAQARGAISGAHERVNTRSTETGVGLTGLVPTAATPSAAFRRPRAALPADGKVDNHLTVSEPIQVGLHVRIAEMTRTLTRELGVNWSRYRQSGQGCAIRRFWPDEQRIAATVGVAASAGFLQHRQPCQAGL